LYNIENTIIFINKREMHLTQSKDHFSSFVRFILYCFKL